jgi:hypothetical protein
MSVGGCVLSIDAVWSRENAKLGVLSRVVEDGKVDREGSQRRILVELHEASQPRLSSRQPPSFKTIPSFVIASSFPGFACVMRACLCHLRLL